MNLGIPELMIIFFIILLVFGAGKIPKIAKDIGSGIREFKKSMNGEDDHKDTPTQTGGKTGA
ncbi:MAG: twin-arginine translocase TatA/TatE family subunit [Spirochaetes bacterium]|jgi:sec-independent protein translocase protein TatA|nr:MAG: twin-arginine translocase TatA/TatE family subunit [Spirochaetota bacterium]